MDNIKNFFEEFKRDLKVGAEIEKTFHLNYFVEEYSRELQEAGFSEGFELAHYRARGIRVKKALLSVDYTNDFVADDGALTCGKPGQELHDYILKTTKEFHTAGEYVAFLIDHHFEKDNHHPERKLFPPHNIDGTDGRDRKSVV